MDEVKKKYTFAEAYELMKETGAIMSYEDAAAGEEYTRDAEGMLFKTAGVLMGTAEMRMAFRNEIRTIPVGFLEVPWAVIGYSPMEAGERIRMYEALIEGREVLYYTAEGATLSRHWAQLETRGERVALIVNAMETDPREAFDKAVGRVSVEHASVL